MNFLVADLKERDRPREFPVIASRSGEQERGDSSIRRDFANLTVSRIPEAADETNRAINEIGKSEQSLALLVPSLPLSFFLTRANTRAAGSVKKRRRVMDDFEFRSAESRVRETTFVPLRAYEVHAFIRCERAWRGVTDSRI